MGIKHPWEAWPEIWNTKAKYLAWLRGGIRRGVWNRSPIKLKIINQKRKRIINPKTGNEVWGGTCYICKQDFLQKDLQVDHKKGQHSLKEIKDIQTFVEAMAGVGIDKVGYDLICKPCHKIKTESESKGISFEEAKIEKQVIAFGKLKAKEQLHRLNQLGLDTKPTAKARKEEYRRWLNEESN